MKNIVSKLSSTFVKINVLVIFSLFIFSQCTMKPRYGYDRKRGEYAKPKTVDKTAVKTSKSTINASKNSKSEKSKSTISKTKTLDDWIKSWEGTPYKFGGTTKRGVDCSGFVMNIMRDWKGVVVPRNTSDAWKVGKSIVKKRLEPGDVVYFGNIWGVSHSGIYIGNNIFAHASSSKGVTRTSLDDAYWKPKYKGARRYY